MARRTPKEFRKIFLDTAPVIYFVEKHPTYFPYLKPIFERFDSGEWEAVISPITISESLIVPMRLEDTATIDAFTRLYENRAVVSCIPIDQSVTLNAAKLRAKDNLLLLDALQISLAIQSQCDAFLTNDKELKRIKNMKFLIVDELTFP